ncbi:hypothetical protein [Streptomyces coffeae]|nr:hypothetical protein [Streptomyces coffeae]
MGGLATVTQPYATTSGSPYTITANYNGDVNYAASAGSTTQQVTN